MLDPKGYIVRSTRDLPDESSNGVMGVRGEGDVRRRTTSLCGYVVDVKVRDIDLLLSVTRGAPRGG